MNTALAQAIREHHIVVFWYDGLTRTVEPHTYGIQKDTGNEVLSGFQTAGFSHSGDLPGWRLYKLSEISSLTITERNFGQTPPATIQMIRGWARYLLGPSIEKELDDSQRKNEWNQTHIF